MLVVQKAFAKILPVSMHSRWDTWTNTWMPAGMHRVALASSAVVPAIASDRPLLMAALCCAGMVGLNTSMLAWHLRDRREWTLPHDAWKKACLAVEEKLSSVVHKPHLHRASALCDLSDVLMDIEMERMRKKDPDYQENYRYKGFGWTSGYTTGTITAMLLEPKVLDRVHASLGFNDEAIEQWVQASYLQRIYQDVLNPMPGTLDTMVRLANDNPASMAFHYTRYPHFFQEVPNRQWRDRRPNGETCMQWFDKTKWPGWLALMRHMQVHIQSDPMPQLTPIDLYRHAVQAHQSSNLDTDRTIDANLFDMDESSMPSV